MRSRQPFNWALDPRDRNELHKEGKRFLVVLVVRIGWLLLAGKVSDVAALDAADITPGAANTSASPTGCAPSPNLRLGRDGHGQPDDAGRSDTGFRAGTGERQPTGSVGSGDGLGEGGGITGDCAVGAVIVGC